MKVQSIKIKVNEELKEFDSMSIDEAINKHLEENGGHLICITPIIRSGYIYSVMATFEHSN